MEKTEMKEGKERSLLGQRQIVKCQKNHKISVTFPFYPWTQNECEIRKELSIGFIKRTVRFEMRLDQRSKFLFN